jgi:hypothetical protein
MYLINEANFTREISVPNITSSQSGNAERLGLYGYEKPRLLLQNCLGSVLFSQLDAQVTDGVLNTDADQKWKDLVNGITYDSKVWKGLNYQEGSFKVSLLAYFTFWYWINDNVTTLGSGGEVQIQTKNASNVNPTSYQVQIWNRFLEMYQGLPYNYCYPSVSHLNGATFVDYYNGGINSNYVSLLQFLQDNPSNYPSPQLFTFENLSNSNSLGL